MKGTKILAADQPKGTHLEGIIAVGSTPKPGVVMEIDYGVEPVAGLHAWQPYGTTAASGGQGVAADGDRKVVAVLLEDHNQGKIYSDAYAAGDRCRLYFPLPGETLNMIVQVQSGTGDTFEIGQEMMVDDGTGKLLEADSDAESHPFTMLETEVTALAADELKWVLFTGY